LSIDIFLDEIENRKKKDISNIDKEFDAKKSEIETKKNTAIKELQEHYSKEAKTKSEKEASRIVEASKLEAKKILFGAINKNLDSTFDVIKQELANYTKTPEYKKVLEKMVSTAKKTFDDKITIHCRKEDESTLKGKGITIGSRFKILQDSQGFSPASGDACRSVPFSSLGWVVAFFFLPGILWEPFSLVS